MAEAKSPGQAACEAFWAYMGTGPDGQPPSAAWDWARSQGAQGAWAAAAEAAVKRRTTMAEASEEYKAHVEALLAPVKAEVAALRAAAERLAAADAFGLGRETEDNDG